VGPVEIAGPIDVTLPFGESCENPNHVIVCNFDDLMMGIEAGATVIGCPPAKNGVIMAVVTQPEDGNGPPTITQIAIYNDGTPPDLNYTGDWVNCDEDVEYIPKPKCNDDTGTIDVEVFAVVGQVETLFTTFSTGIPCAEIDDHEFSIVLECRDGFVWRAIYTSLNGSVPTELSAVQTSEQCNVVPEQPTLVDCGGTEGEEVCTLRADLIDCASMALVAATQPFTSPNGTPFTAPTISGNVAVGNAGVSSDYSLTFTHSMFNQISGTPGYVSGSYEVDAYLKIAGCELNAGPTYVADGGNANAPLGNSYVFSDLNGGSFTPNDGGTYTNQDWFDALLGDGGYCLQYVIRWKVQCGDAQIPFVYDSGVLDTPTGFAQPHQTGGANNSVNAEIPITVDNIRIDYNALGDEFKNCEVTPGEPGGRAWLVALCQDSIDAIGSAVASALSMVGLNVGGKSCDDPLHVKVCETPPPVVKIDVECNLETGMYDVYSVTVTDGVAADPVITATDRPCVDDVKPDFETKRECRDGFYNVVVYAIDADGVASEVAAIVTTEECDTCSLDSHPAEKRVIRVGIENTGTRYNGSPTIEHPLAGGGIRTMTIPATSNWGPQMIEWEAQYKLLFPEACRVERQWWEWRPANLPNTGAGSIPASEIEFPVARGQFIMLEFCAADAHLVPVGAVVIDSSRPADIHPLIMSDVQPFVEQTTICTSCDPDCEPEREKCVYPVGATLPETPSTLCSTTSKFACEISLPTQDDDGNPVPAGLVTPNILISVISCQDGSQSIIATEYPDGFDNEDTSEPHALGEGNYYGDCDSLEPIVEPEPPKGDFLYAKELCTTVAVSILDNNPDYPCNQNPRPIIKYSSNVEFEFTLGSGATFLANQTATGGWSPQFQDAGGMTDTTVPTSVISAYTAAVLAQGGTPGTVQAGCGITGCGGLPGILADIAATGLTPFARHLGFVACSVDDLPVSVEILATDELTGSLVAVGDVFDLCPKETTISFTQEFWCRPDGSVYNILLDSCGNEIDPRTLPPCECWGSCESEVSGFPEEVVGTCGGEETTCAYGASIPRDNVWQPSEGGMIWAICGETYTVPAGEYSNTEIAAWLTANTPHSASVVDPDPDAPEKNVIFHINIPCDCEAPSFQFGDDEPVVLPELPAYNTDGSGDAENFVRVGLNRCDKEWLCEKLEDIVPTIPQPDCGTGDSGSTGGGLGDCPCEVDAGRFDPDVGSGRDSIQPQADGTFIIKSGSPSGILERLLHPDSGHPCVGADFVIMHVMRDGASNQQEGDTGWILIHPGQVTNQTGPFGTSTSAWDPSIELSSPCSFDVIKERVLSEQGSSFFGDAELQTLLGGGVVVTNGSNPFDTINGDFYVNGFAWGDGGSAETDTADQFPGNKFGRCYAFTIPDDCEETEPEANQVVPTHDQCNASLLTAILTALQNQKSVQLVEACDAAGENPTIYEYLYEGHTLVGVQPLQVADGQFPCNACCTKDEEELPDEGTAAECLVSKTGLQISSNAAGEITNDNVWAGSATATTPGNGWTITNITVTDSAGTPHSLGVNAGDTATGLASGSTTGVTVSGFIIKTRLDGSEYSCTVTDRAISANVVVQ